MKTEQEIREKFHELVVQRDRCTGGSMAHKTLTQRLVALTWVIGHPLASELVLTRN